MQDLNSTHNQTIQMLKQQNQVHLETIKNLKRDLSMGEQKSVSLSAQKDQLDYSLKAALHNVEILKNRLEDIQSEQLLLQNLAEKQKKHLCAVRQLNQRMRTDLDYLKKGKKPPKQEPKELLNMSAVISENLGYSLNELSFTGLVECKNQEQQTDLLGESLDQALGEQKAPKQKPSARRCSQRDSLHALEETKKLKFDNQILMTRLTEYKRAERGAKELCAEYETVKVKYF